MMALEGAPADAGWARSLGSVAAVNPMAPSRTSPFWTGQDPAVKQNLVLFMA
jgi:hypothetical protein